MDENQGTGQTPGAGAPPPPQYNQPGPVPQGGPPPRAPVPPRGAKEKKRGGWGKILVTAVVAGLVGALLVLVVMPWGFGVNPYDLIRGKLKNAGTGEQNKKDVQVNVLSPSTGALNVATIARKIIPSIVNIDVRTAPQGFQTGGQEGTGSGVIYKEDGYILTNNHVVGDAQEISVTLASGEKLTGKQVGADPENDIAVVKVDKSGLPTLTPGDSDNLMVGEVAVAVGSPFGFEQSVTSGIISALHRNVPAQSSDGATVVLTDLIQTDAAINPGNSGGALCDSQARLIGINTLIASSSGGSQGVGFAIPINTAKRVADDIIAGRPISHPYIGVSGQSVSENIATEYDLPVSSGAYVTNTVSGGPADKAGIKSGDIITEIDGRPVKSMDDLVAEVRKGKVGDKVTVTYYSGTDKKTAQVTLEEKPKNLQ